MVYNLSFEYTAVAIELAIGIFGFSKKIHKNQEGVFFFLSLGCCLFNSVFNILSKYYLNNYPSQLIPIIVFETLRFFFLVTSIDLTTIYISLMVGAVNRHSHFFDLLYSLPVVIVYGLLVFNPINGFLFTVSEVNGLTYSYGAFAFYAVVIFYFAMDIFILINFRCGLDKPRSILLFAIGAFDMGMFIADFYIPKELLTGMALSFTHLFLLYVFEFNGSILDTNTGLYNRATFFTFLKKNIEQKKHFSIITVNLTNMAFFSQTVGIEKTIPVTRSIGQSIYRFNHDNNTYYLGNGFYALFSYTNNNERLKKTIEDIREFLNKDLVQDKSSYHFITQICFFSYPQDVTTIEQIHAIADQVFPSANQRVTIIQGEELKTAQRELDVQKAIERGLDAKSFKVFYQPIYDINKKKFHSAEALIRLTDPVMGPISPEEFIKVAEKTGKVEVIDNLVFEAACKTLRKSADEKSGLDFIEVNLSTIQCLQPGLADKFYANIEKYGLKPSNINLEITESAQILSPIAFKQSIRALHNKGFFFSLDDYGTGFSSNAYLESTSFNIVKIDKSLLWSIKDTPKAEITLRNTILMLKKMGYKVLMEGVETAEQRDLIIDCGCDFIQGFFYSKAISQEDLLPFLSAHNPGGEKV